MRKGNVTKPQPGSLTRCKQPGVHLNSYNSFMKNSLLITLVVIGSIFLSSCFKKWTCTCTFYKAYFSDSFVNGMWMPKKDTTLAKSESEFLSSKKKAKSECDRQLKSSKEHAISISADPNQVNCTLK